MKTVGGIMLILDGLGDRPVPAFGGDTPLESARTPHLDAMAERGLTGLMSPLAPGVPVDTVTGVTALMGVPAPQAVIPRGPVEAAGVGIDLLAGDVALRANFATVSESRGELRLEDRRAGRVNGCTRDLACALKDGDAGSSMIIHKTLRYIRITTP